MNAWWLSLSGLEQVLFCVAIPATLLMVVQTLLLLFGIHGPGEVSSGGGDVDSSMDGHDWGNPHEDIINIDNYYTPSDSAAAHDGLFAGLHLLTLRGTIAFFSIFGWGSLWLLQMGLHFFPALLLGAAMGFCGMVLIAVLLKVAMQLQYDGTMDPRNALGVSGTVYLTIPAAREGAGKISIMIQEQVSEADAVTDDPEPIPTGNEITVVGLSGKNILVVTKK
ncbi:MAG: hypothetical protein H6Q60_1482 [Oscillospiraceae bacterium]|nr:hypothetical protein [Oscillospiraceae bacterium]